MVIAFCFICESYAFVSIMQLWYFGWVFDNYDNQQFSNFKVFGSARSLTRTGHIKECWWLIRRAIMEDFNYNTVTYCQMPKSSALSHQHTSGFLPTIAKVTVPPHTCSQAPNTKQINNHSFWHPCMCDFQEHIWVKYR